MWKDSREDHCSDEQLLAHLDRGLGRREAARVARHLGECWSCRARANDLDREAQNLALLLNNRPLSSPARAAELKSAFLAYRTKFEAGNTPRKTIIRFWRLAPVAAVLAAVLAAVVWLGRRDRPPDAPATLLATQAVEEEAGPSRAVHQVVSVTVAQSYPLEREASGTLEIWSDAPGKRYAERWTARQGALKHAVWQPSAQRAYRYVNGQLAPANPPLGGTVSLARLSRDESVEVEDLFFRWLHGRPWRAVSFSGHFAEFVHEGPVRLLAVRAGAGVIRLVAERMMDGTRVTLTFDVAVGSHRPRLLTARYESPRRTFEIRLAAERLDAVSPGSFHAAVFTPPGDLLPARLAASPRPQTTLPPVVPPRAPAEESRMKVLYAMHRAGACRDEFLELTREDSGRLRLRMIAATAERRRTLLAALGALGPLELVIETGRPSRARPAPASGSRVSRLAAEAWDAAYLEALALVRLAGQSQGAWAVDPDEADRRLLESMIADHLRSLRLHLNLVREEMAPLWNGQPPASPPPAAPAASWQVLATGQFRAVDELDDRLEKLIARPQEDPAPFLEAWTAMAAAVARADAWIARR